MKKETRVIFLCIALLYAAVSQAQSKDVQPQSLSQYSNPLAVAFGDPYVLPDADGRYYMYGTGGGAKNGFAAYSSGDMVNWKYEGQVYTANGPKAWGIHSFWAPEVYRSNGKYYMFYSAQWKVNPTNELENFRIGVAVADKPTGPFTDISNKPLFDPGYPVIDANVFVDLITVRPTCITRAAVTNTRYKAR